MDVFVFSQGDGQSETNGVHSTVMPALDAGIHLDPRVKPGGDEKRDVMEHTHLFSIHQQI